MAAIKKEILEQIEEAHGLEPGGLTYQERCSRATAYQQNKGHLWSRENLNGWKKQRAREEKQKQDIKDHPLYGKKILITPLVTPDAKRALYYEEDLGPLMEVAEVDAGEEIQNASDETQRMLKDYKVTSVRTDRHTYAKSWVPKIGQEISYTVGKDLVPVSRGNDGSTGYIWSYPTRTIQVEDTLIQIYGLKTLIQTVYPELLDKFRGKPMMSYQDGVQLIASIPQTHALLKKHRRQELADKKAGLI